MLQHTNRSLKDQNLHLLLAFLVAHALAFAVTMSLAQIDTDSLHWQSLLVEGVLVVAFGTLVVALLNSQLDARMKARLIFWRWKEPLPGGEAFSRWAHTDDRIDAAALEVSHGPFPTQRREQNRQFYKMFQDVEDHPQIVDANRWYLLFRDAAVMGLFATLVLGGAALLLDSTWRIQFAYWAALIIVEALFIRAARTSGVRLVRNVLAAAQKG